MHSVGVQGAGRVGGAGQGCCDVRVLVGGKKGEDGPRVLVGGGVGRDELEQAGRSKREVFACWGEARRGEHTWGQFSPHH